MKLSDAWNPAAGKSETRDVDLAAYLHETNTDALYQAPILQNCLNTLVGKDLIHEAYLRGSFGRGLADVHSDIDLFTVVDADKLEETLGVVRDYLKTNLIEVTDCYDRYVPPYGGLGFTFLCKEKEHGHILQFDFYMAIKGVCGSETLRAAPRIYAKDPLQKWTSDPTAVNTTWHLSDKAKKFIGHYKNEEDPASLAFDEFMVVMHYVHKHLARGQTGRFILDDNFLMQTCASLLEQAANTKMPDVSPLYNINRTIDICCEYGDMELAKIATRLDALLMQAPSQKKMDDLYYIAKDIFKNAYPEKYAKIEDRVKSFEENILNKPLPLTRKPGSGTSPNNA